MEPTLDASEKATLRVQIRSAREHLSEVLSGVQAGDITKAKTDLMYAQEAMDEVKRGLLAAAGD